MLADGLGLSRSVQGLMAHLFERWDGHGPLGHAKGEQIPLPMRIVSVAVDRHRLRRAARGRRP
jgi:response regulator RpfG family c-di-GMP phosphodiesterase